MLGLHLDYASLPGTVHVCDVYRLAVIMGDQMLVSRGQWMCQEQYVLQVCACVCVVGV